MNKLINIDKTIDIPGKMNSHRNHRKQYGKMNTLDKARANMDVLLVFQIINTLFFGVFGLVIGSFLNVCIYRIPEGRTIVKGHSMCMSCGHELGAPDLVPLFSWLFLKGKCRYCGSPISSRYAKIELLTGLVFAGLAWQRRDSFYLPAASVPDIIRFMTLIILLALTAIVIVSMMIQKDHKSGMFRLSASVFALLPIRVILCFFDLPTLLPVLQSASKSFLLSAVIVFLLIIITPFDLRSPRVFFGDIFTGKSFRDYFAPSGKTIRTSDLLFIAVATIIGFPASVPCLFAYAAVRTIRNQDIFLAYLGIVIAAAALAGVVIFPGTIL